MIHKNKFIYTDEDMAVITIIKNIAADQTINK